MPVLRIAGALAALAVCAWFAIGVRQVKDTQRATAIISGRVHADPAQAASLVGDARLLNPDRMLDLLDVQLALARGQTAQARRLAHQLVQAEPMNVAAWLWYGRSSGGDPAVFLVALAHARALDPLPLRH